MAVDVVARALAIKAQQGGGPGSSDYATLTNKPSINGVTLEGNKTSSDLGIEQPIYWDGEIDENGNALAMFQGAYDYYLTTGTMKNIQYKKVESNGEVSILPLININIGWAGSDVYFIFSTLDGAPNTYTNPELKYRNYKFSQSNNVLSYNSYTSFESFGFNLAHTFTGANVNYGGCLEVDNTKSYTPTSDYNPATKKYVDDMVGDINTVLATLTTVSEVSE